jgi:hypothetical protein
MNAEHPVPLLTLSTVNLSVDGARITPDDGKANVPVTEAVALAALQAFARLSALELVNAEAKIYLAGPRGRVAVQNEGGKLFFALVPESVNTAAERTPEEIIAWLTARDSAMAPSAGAAAAVKDAALLTEAAQQPGGWKSRWRSGWTVAGLAVVAAVAAYFNFAPETPDGVAIIRDSARISSLHAEFSGRYGEPPATILVLDHGRLTGQGAAAKGGTGTPLFEKSYRYGLRGDQVVLVVDNGALLEPQPDGSLKFMDSTYPKQGR